MKSPDILHIVDIEIEAISKPRLRPDDCVAAFLKMLTAYRVCSAFSSTCALPSNLIQGFETASCILNPKTTTIFRESLSEKGFPCRRVVL